MKDKLLVVLLITGVLAGGWSVRLYAHHSFSATYFSDQTVKIEGKMIQFQYRNPHSFLTVEAPDEQGAMQRWAIEWGGAGQLGTQGVSRETLKPGDQIMISGNPGRNPADHRMRLLYLRRPSDGLEWGKRPGEVVE